MNIFNVDGTAVVDRLSFCMQFEFGAISELSRSCREESQQAVSDGERPLRDFL